MLASWTTDMWSPIINLFSFIPSYGFMIIVFTICLKIILSPLDFWQKKVSRASMLKQQKLQPEIAKLQKRYGNNKQLLNQKTMELYKRENYNVIGSCLSMLLNLAITLFIFITLFTGLIGISQDKTYNQYLEIETAYYTTFNSEFRAEYNLTAEENDADISRKWNELVSARLDEARQLLIEEGNEEPTEEQINSRAAQLVYETENITAIVSSAQDSASTRYEEIKDNWLWVDNIWRPDTYVAGFPDYSAFRNMSNLEARLSDNPDRLSQIEQNFDTITAKIQTNYSSWNGYFILVVLAGVVTFLSFMVTDMTNSKKNKDKKQQLANQDPQQKQANQVAGAGKILKFIMPVIMIIFTISYSAAFAIYIVMNSLMSLIISFISLKIIEKMEKNKENKDKDSKKVSYSR